MRRAFDIVFAVVTGIVLLPLFAAVAGMVLIAMGRPVLFRQTRPGLNNVRFEVVKFRTMREPQFDGEPDHERTPRLGAFLRASSLDEIPQLWNILRGQMSLIGPRPLPVRPAEAYTPAELNRLSVRPGLTGWAQVNGRNAISATERTELDIWYIFNRSLILDLKILFLTIVRVLGAQGIYGPLEPRKPRNESGHTDDATVAEVATAASGLPNTQGIER